MSQYPNVFILDPKHQQFPANRHELMEKAVFRALPAALFVMSAMFATGLIFYSEGSSPGLDSMKVSFGGIAAVLFVLGVLVITQQNRRHELYAHGQLLVGALVKCTGKYDSDAGYFIRAVYRFQSPSGDLISGKSACSNDALQGFPLPTSGTPVQVLYVSDRNHMML